MISHTTYLQRCEGVDEFPVLRGLESGDVGLGHAGVGRHCERDTADKLGRAGTVDPELRREGEGEG